MSLTRVTRTFTVLVAVAALAALLAACGGGGNDPQSVVEESTLGGVESGRLEAEVRVNSSAPQGGHLVATLSGPFQSGPAGSLPELAMTAAAHGTANGEALDFEGELTLLSDRAFVGLEGKEYEVDPTAFGFIRSGFEHAQQGQGKEAEAAAATACQGAASGLGFSQFVQNPESEGGVDVNGVSTTRVSGDLSAGGAVDAVIQLVEDPACKAQIELAGSLPLAELKRAKSELAKSIKGSHVDLYVGEDQIIRKLVGELIVQPPGSSERVALELQLTLSEVNQDQKIEAPADAKPLQDLFRELGVNPLQLLQDGGSSGIGGLLEALAGGGSSSGPSGGGSSSGALGGGNQQEYVECLQEAQTPTDLQKCASLLR